MAERGLDTATMARRLGAIETYLAAAIRMLEDARDVGRNVLYVTDDLRLDLERMLDRPRRAFDKARDRLLEIDARGPSLGICSHSRVRRGARR
jgi:hypothetical protein